MTTPQDPERGDASPEQSDDHKSASGEPEPLESAGTDRATPAANGPWESPHVEPAAPLPPQSDAPGFAAQPESEGPDAQTPAQRRAAAETAPDLVTQPQPSSAEAGDRSQPQPSGPADTADPTRQQLGQSAQQAQPSDSTGAPNQSPTSPEPGGTAPGAPYDQQPYPPGTVYPPISDTAPESPYGGYPAYPQQPYQPYRKESARSDGQTLSIIGFVCAGISLLFCPYLFGPAGIILGVIGHRKGESLGKWAAIASAISLIVGLIVSYVVFSGSMIPDSD
ncbi:hypothetical protein ACQP0C_06560 [Nocardia sp. CA-129566]|uniref:hypothetical protein n=1 Tax=Nocardia sp. CA-129566 TaxID=3239976 RepID=UPI003D98D8C6